VTEVVTSFCSGRSELARAERDPNVPSRKLRVSSRHERTRLERRAAGARRGVRL